MARVEILNEVMLHEPGDWRLCFHWCSCNYDDGRQSQLGYRFIWRRPNGNLQAARGQARIPSASDLFELMRLATDAGWFINAERL